MQSISQGFLSLCNKHLLPKLNTRIHKTCLLLYYRNELYTSELKIAQLASSENVTCHSLSAVKCEFDRRSLIAALVEDARLLVLFYALFFLNERVSFRFKV